jgi:uncharacterized membrane protein
MSYFVVITFDNEVEAGKARETLRNAQKQGYLELGDAVTITKGLDGKVMVKDEMDRGVKWGALGGSFLGVLIGGLFFPVTGIVLGAVGGGMVGKWVSVGVDKDFKREVTESLQPGSSALFLVVPPAYLDYTIAALKPYQGQVYHTSIPEDAEKELYDVLKQRVGTLENQIIVLGFEGQGSAEEAYKKVLEWHEKRIVNLEDAVIAYREFDDKVHIRQTKTLTSKYAVKGGGAGFLVGLLMGGPIAGLAIGAAAGAIAAKRKDIGIDDFVIQDVSDQMRPYTSLLFVLGKSLDPQRLSKELSELDAAVIETLLTDQEQERLLQFFRGNNDEALTLSRSL